MSADKQTMAKRNSQKQSDERQLDKTGEIKKDVAVVKKEIANLTHKDDPNNVLREAEKKMVSLDFEAYDAKGDDPIFKAMTLREFDNGALLTMTVPDYCKTFGIDLMRKFQNEYGCVTASEKATTELVAINYCRTLEIQRRVNNLLSKDSLGRIDLEFFSILCKELDRANRHYLSAVQALKVMKQPQFQLNIKTDTAILGNNQLIQENKHE